MRRRSGRSSGRRSEHVAAFPPTLDLELERCSEQLIACTRHTRARGDAPCTCIAYATYAERFKAS